MGYKNRSNGGEMLIFETELTGYEIFKPKLNGIWNTQVAI